MGVVVRGGADVVALRDHHMTPDNDRHKVLNLGIGPDGRPFAHGQIPRHPDFYACADLAARRNPRAEELEQGNAQRAEGLGGVWQKGKLKQSPDCAQQLDLRWRTGRHLRQIDAQWPFSGQRAIQFRFFRFRFQFRTQPNPHASRSALRTGSALPRL